MGNFKITKNPFLLFLPFLLLYIVIILLFPTDGKFGDEGRYIIYAKYMVHGHLPAGEEGFDTLGNGPGYSMILTPFVAMGLPLIYMTLLNGFFFYFSIILLFKTLSKFTTFKKTMIICLFWSLYLNLYEYFIKILPETFTSFLICLLLFGIVNAFTKPNFKKYIFLSGITIGYIALTKPIFGYVILVMLAGAAVCWIIKRQSKNYRQGLFILLLALATITPYLIYTYSISGKVFYMSSFGGTSLYWMTTPYEKEYGSWFPDILPNSPDGAVDSNTTKNLIKSYDDYLKVGHLKNFEEINKYTGVQRDDAYKKIAIKNIKEHPGKFVANCISNIGRIFFNFPYSYKMQSLRTLVRLPFTGTMTVLLIFCILPTIKNWRKIDFPVRFLLFFAMIYLGGSIFGSAETRMLTVIAPVLLFYIGYIFEKIFKIRFKFD